MAERLTKHGKTTHENGICCTHFSGEECVKLQGDCSNGCLWEEKVWEKLAHYEDLEEQGRMVILPDGMNLRKLLDILTEYSPGCPSDYNLINRCELSCFECWLAALKGAENATR